MFLRRGDNMNKITIPIQGMHCRSCEILIEDNLKNINNVEKAIVDHKKGTAEIHYQGRVLDQNKVMEAIESAGYKLGTAEKQPLISTNWKDWTDLSLSLMVLFILYVLVDALGLTKIFSVGTSQPSNLLAVLLIGVTAGFSSCMALVGGLILGLSARFAEMHPETSSIQRFKPHLFFNAGRILSYIFLGGLIGLAGSFLQLSGVTLGLMTLAVTLVMFTLGLQLTGLFPRFTSMNLTLPKGISRKLGIGKRQSHEYSHTNAMILGALTFFLPCGFTQAMQLFAISTGNFLQGGAIMGAFAIGTVPGLLGVGGLTSVIKGTFAFRFFKFAGVVVVVFAFFNLSNGINLLGLHTLTSAGNTNVNSAVITDPNVTREGNVQIVRMTQKANGYSPNSFTIIKDIPVRWIINSVDPNSCASSIVSDKLNIRKTLHAGENITEFTPKETGRIGFSCSMGMYTGVFNVVDKDGKQSEAVNTVQAADNQQTNNMPGCGMNSGGGCNCGSAKGGCGCGGK